MSVVKGLNENTFSFSEAYQADIISAMLQKPELYTRVGIQINPNYFELKEYKDIFKTIKNYYDEYIALPSNDVLKELVSRINNDENVSSDIDRIYNTKIKDSDCKQIESDVVNFISYQAMKNSVMNCVDLLNNPDNYSKMKSEIDKALIVSQSLQDTGVDVYSDTAIIERWDKRKEDKEVRRIKTGWNTFDEIFGGGLEAGTITSVCSPANVGKSFVLVNIGANCLLQGLNVLHVSCEMSEASCAMRYDSRLLGLTQEEIKRADSNSVSKLRDLLDKRIGRLFLKQFPAMTLTPTDLNTFIERLENVNNIKLDIIVCDYADILKAETNINERRFQLESIYLGLRNIALERNVVMMTATQLNRSSIEATKNGQMLDNSMIAESYGISRHCDGLFTINATPQDILNHTLVFYISKNRQGAMGQQIRMYCDYSKALIKEWTTDYKSNIQSQNNHEEKKPENTNSLKSVFIKN